MSPFSIPAPSIVPLRNPVFGAKKTIDTRTKIELTCGTYHHHEVFYTLDGTRPQPYAGIIQGSKLHRYQAPFCLPAGKVTVKALALNSLVRTMRSNVVTKCFEVLKCESDPPASAKVPKKKKKKVPSEEVVVETDLRVGIGEGNLSGEDFVGCGVGGGNKKDSYEDEPHSSVEDFPVNFDIILCNGDDASLSSQSGRSIASLPEGEDALNVAKYESEQETPASSAPQSPVKERVVRNGFGDGLKVESKSCSCNIQSASPLCCFKCEGPIHCCSTCNTLNEIASKYCIACGQGLMQECAGCREFNYAIATFCQFCGQKLQLSEDSKGDVDCGDVGGLSVFSAGVQSSPVLSTKQTQTRAGRREKKAPRSLPSRSPGRGYWHQQLDYICNHLKSYAYNNNEFRDSISEPMLSDFQAARVTKSDDSVSITLTFSPFSLSEKL